MYLYPFTSLLVPFPIVLKISTSVKRYNLSHQFRVIQNELVYKLPLLPHSLFRQSPSLTLVKSVFLERIDSMLVQMTEVPCRSSGYTDFTVLYSSLIILFHSLFITLLFPLPKTEKKDTLYPRKRLNTPLLTRLYPRR